MSTSALPGPLRLFSIVTWLCRGFLAFILVASLYDLIHFSTNPSAYPIPSTEIGDPRYASASRFIWTNSVDGGIAVLGLILWLFLARRDSRTAAAVSSIVFAAVLIMEARIVSRLLA